MAVPVEVWMHIFEQLDFQDSTARPTKVEQFVVSAQSDEESAVKALPGFERQAWKATKAYYHVNQASRAAAEKLDLTTKLLQTCTSPVSIMVQGPVKDHHGGMLNLEFYHEGLHKKIVDVVDTVDLFRQMDEESPLPQGVFMREVLHLLVERCVIVAEEQNVSQVNILAQTPDGALTGIAWSEIVRAIRERFEQSKELKEIEVKVWK